MDKFSELKAAAMAATPGLWGINRTGNTIVSNQSHPVATVSGAFHRQLAGGGVGKDAEFIAAANPAVVLELLAELEAKDAPKDIRIAETEKRLKQRAEEAESRIAQLEAIRADASLVLKEIGNELGCNPDNESIMMAIDALKEREKRVVALAGGNADLWETMAARLEAAEAKLATPVRLPDTRQSVSGDRYQWSDGVFNYKQDAIALLREQGFTVEGDK